MQADSGHILPDVLKTGLTLVFCGTAAGKRSAAEGAYYAHPGNLFWRALHQAALTPRLLAPAEFPQLPNYGIGLTDLAKHHIGNDNQLPRDAFDAAALLVKIEHYAPRMLAFTSKNGARAALGRSIDYGLNRARLATRRSSCCPPHRDRRAATGRSRHGWTWLHSPAGCVRSQTAEAPSRAASSGIC